MRPIYDDFEEIHRRATSLSAILSKKRTELIELGTPTCPQLITKLRKTAKHINELCCLIEDNTR